MSKDNFDQKKARADFWNWWHKQSADYRRLNSAPAMLKGWMAAMEYKGQ